MSREYIDPITKEVYYEYAFSYNFKDREWSVNLWAISPEEAQERINTLYYAKYDGRVVDSIPMKGKANIVDKAYMYIRALYIKLFE